MIVLLFGFCLGYTAMHLYLVARQSLPFRRLAWLLFPRWSARRTIERAMRQRAEITGEDLSDIRRKLLRGRP